MFNFLFFYLYSSDTYKLSIRNNLGIRGTKILIISRLNLFVGSCTSNAFLNKSLYLKKIYWILIFQKFCNWVLTISWSSISLTCFSYFQTHKKRRSWSSIICCTLYTWSLTMLHYTIHTTLSIKFTNVNFLI